jgi:uridine phosphorylase
MSTDPFFPLLKLHASAIAPLALVVGDPARAEAASKLMDKAEKVGSNREYVTYTGTLKGERITIASHGVGSGGAAVCFEELARAGVKTVIRAGTCGGLQPPINDGDLILATGAIRDEGLTERLIPTMYPAVAHYKVLNALQDAANVEKSVTTYTGLVMSSDVFYPSAVMPRGWTMWTDSHVQAVEMELSALLIIAALHNIRAGGIFVADGNLTRTQVDDMSDYDPHRTVVSDAKMQMLKIALNALVRLG